MFIFPVLIFSFFNPVASLNPPDHFIPVESSNIADTELNLALNKLTELLSTILNVSVSGKYLFNLPL